MGKGWIALDIDGTLLEGMQPIPVPVITYLEKLHNSGWKILFITGRTFAFAERDLKTLGFPYYLALQHGADIVHMPSKTVFEERYLDSEVLHHIEKAFRNEAGDYIVYSGFAKGDYCYYRECFPIDYQSYFERLQSFSKTAWQVMRSIEELRGIRFPLVKCFGSEKVMHKIGERLSEIPGLEVAVIREPVDSSLYLGLITDKEATKGKALHRVLLKAGRKKNERVIAAGDDRNDLSMLREADIRIVMETAPPEVLAEGDIIAESAGKMGILRALAEATKE